MATFLEWALMVSYIGPAIVLMLFGINLYVMLLLFGHKRSRAKKQGKEIRRQFNTRYDEDDLPRVATQIPLYNECNVAERILRAVAEMDYPGDRHTVQILDDSTDETCAIVDRVARELRAQGHDIQVIRRDSREGYKAGALEHGMRCTDAEFFAIFDADFVPPRDFLRRTVEVMMVREEVGLVQGRWGHLNARRSLLTRAQGIGIDGHFTIEQPARAWNNLFMNFNGTAGLWRRRAIEAAGGWEHDTLTEDMDLSYRAQMAGWQPYFLPDLEVPAELPESINAFKSQQFRWAKGSIQTALKLLPRVFRSRHGLLAKVQAVFHMAHYSIHPIMLWLSLMALPVLLLTRLGNNAAVFSLIFVGLILTTLAPSLLYFVSQCYLYRHGWTRLRFLPFLTAIGIGIAISNSRAVWEALRGKPSEFVRTPKKGDRPLLNYRIKMPLLPLLELLLGLYCFLTLVYYFRVREFLIWPFLFLYAIGFTVVGSISLFHTFREGRRPA